MALTVTAAAIFYLYSKESSHIKLWNHTNNFLFKLFTLYHTLNVYIFNKRPTNPFRRWLGIVDVLRQQLKQKLKTNSKSVDTTLR